MSRLSRANLQARDSVFNTRPEVFRGDIQAICPPNLIDCVMALEDCCQEVCRQPFVHFVCLMRACLQAYEAEELLRTGTLDYPRMTKVLKSERVRVDLYTARGSI